MPGEKSRFGGPHGPKPGERPGIGLNGAFSSLGVFSITNF